ncbi:hypothetical protein PFISCL1PPCAC_22051, partial [Pristionchus fissidentatus]
SLTMDAALPKSDSRFSCCGASLNKLLCFAYAVLLTAAHALLVCASVAEILYGPLKQSLVPLFLQCVLTILYATVAIGVLLKCNCLLRIYKWTLLASGIIFTAYTASAMYKWMTGAGSTGTDLKSTLIAFLGTLIILCMLTRAFRTTERYREELREARQEQEVYHQIKTPSDNMSV